MADIIKSIDELDMEIKELDIRINEPKSPRTLNELLNTKNNKFNQKIRLTNLYRNIKIYYLKIKSQKKGNMIMILQNQINQIHQKKII